MLAMLFIILSRKPNLVYSNNQLFHMMEAQNLMKCFKI